MDIKVIKDLSNKYTADELNAAAEEFESSGKCSLSDKTDPNDIMSDLLQSAEVRQLMDSGLTQSDAVRSFSQRVRGVIS